MFLTQLLGALTCFGQPAQADSRDCIHVAASWCVHWITKIHGNLALHFAVLQSAAQRVVLSSSPRMQALKAANVDFIVAPFEADAQMAYLAVNELVHAVITEDSDLLPYGCPRVRHKLTV